MFSLLVQWRLLLSRREERAADTAVRRRDGGVEDIAPLDEQADVDGMMANPVPASFSLGSRFVRLAASVVKAKVGFSVMEDTKANRMVISREFRRWALDRGVRPAHIAAAEPMVIEATLIPTRYELAAAVVRASAARQLAVQSTNRVSLYGGLLGLNDLRLTTPQ